jgi:hypothetical protein
VGITTESTTFRRPTLLVAFLLVYWLLGMLSFMFYFGRHPVYSITMCALSVLAVVGTCVGWKWFFWVGMIFTAETLHISTAMLVASLMEDSSRLGVRLVRIAFGVLVLFGMQAPSTLQWFRFQNSRRIRIVFWSIYVALFTYSAIGVALELTRAK